jgi:hypothetical protein
VEGSDEEGSQESNDIDLSPMIEYKKSHSSPIKEDSSRLRIVCEKNLQAFA